MVLSTLTPGAGFLFAFFQLIVQSDFISAQVVRIDCYVLLSVRFTNSYGEPVIGGVGSSWFSDGRLASACW